MMFVYVFGVKLCCCCVLCLVGDVFIEIELCGLKTCEDKEYI